MTALSTAAWITAASNQCNMKYLKVRLNWTDEIDIGTHACYAILNISYN